MPGVENKNRKQPTYPQVLTPVLSAHGIEHANAELPMPTTSPITLAGPTPNAAPPSERLPSAAAALVERVVRTAELATSQPTEQVSVRVDLPDLGLVEVRVALRDGQIQTAFHSNSPEVRESLATAWNGFMNGREGSSHTWAEPTFAPLASTPAPDSSGAAGGPSFAQQSAGQGGNHSQQGRSPAGGDRPPAATDSGSAPVSVPVPAHEPTNLHPRRHLHATA